MVARILRNHRHLAGQIFRDPLCLPDTRADDPLPLVIFSQVAWDSVWQRPQEQAIGLARYRPVLFLGPTQLHEQPPSFAGWAKDLRPRPKDLPLLEVFAPMLFSGEYRSPAIRALNRAMLRRVLGPLRGKRMILLANSPFFADIAAWLRPTLTAIDLIDDFCAFAWAPKDSHRREDQLLAQATIGFSGTSWLQERYQPRFPKLRFLQNGVRFEALTSPAPEPADLRTIPRPRLLYTGTLNDRLDPALIDRLAQAHPHASIVLVGPRYETFPLLKRANIHYLGLKPHEALAGYLQHSQVGILPYADNEAARATNPTKTLEYLAVGLPVLSTPIPDVERFFSHVVRVEKPPAWADAVTALLTQSEEKEKKFRQAVASEYRWDAVTDRMEKAFRTAERRVR